MAAEHSPGPWTYKPSESDNSLFQVLDATGRVVAFVRRGNGGRAEAREFEENARLIADAPRLFAGTAGVVVGADETKAQHPLMPATDAEGGR